MRGRVLSSSRCLYALCSLLRHLADQALVIIDQAEGDRVGWAGLRTGGGELTIAQLLVL